MSPTRFTLYVSCPSGVRHIPASSDSYDVVDTFYDSDDDLSYLDYVDYYECGGSDEL